MLIATSDPKLKAAMEKAHRERSAAFWSFFRLPKFRQAARTDGFVTA